MSHRHLGLQINLAGALDAIEAMKARAAWRWDAMCSASSIGVTGPRASYPAGIVPMLADFLPVRVCAGWKLTTKRCSKYSARKRGFTASQLAARHLLRTGTRRGPDLDSDDRREATGIGASFSDPFLARGRIAFGHPTSAVRGWECGPRTRSTAMTCLGCPCGHWRPMSSWQACLLQQLT